MTFVNEFVSETDIQLNDLDGLIARENKHAWKDGRPVVFRHAWTVDRERHAFLIRLSYEIDYNTRSGIPMITSEENCLLRWNGVDILFRLSLVNYVPKPNKKFSWSIKNLESTSTFDKLAAVQIIKEAVTVRGKHGAFAADDTFETEFV